MRSSNGCWTCRLRRKKCDEKYPVCDVCSALHITCHFEPERPVWMDGGARQEWMHEQLKREVKERPQRRSGGQSTVHISTGDRIELSEISDTHSRDGTEPRSESSPSTSVASNHQPQRGTACTLMNKKGPAGYSFGQPDPILLTFYLDHVFPFLYPFYQPSPLREGGRAWILEMMLGSPVVRQAALCQSSYFFAMAQGRDKCEATWETVLAQTREAFGVLRHALQVIDDPNPNLGSGRAEHLHGAVRILTSIIQVQRFDVNVPSFHNSQMHLGAAIALFLQVLSSADVGERMAEHGANTSTNFNVVMIHLGALPRPPCGFPAPVVREFPAPPTAEQAALRFSSTLLILDDIIASTVLQEEPRLYEHHHNLLIGSSSSDTGGSNNSTGSGPPINIEAVMGCQNWVMLQIGEIAALDAWKQRCKRAGNLNVMELVHRAAVIKDALETRLAHLEKTESSSAAAAISPNDGDIGSGLLDLFAEDTTGHQQSNDTHRHNSKTSLVTRVWAHAALIYLLVVVSGWQPAGTDVRYHVSQILKLLACRISPPALLRTMVWPFCVAGCLAEPEQEAPLRGMVEALQPARVFGTVHKALEIMENVWRNRDVGDLASRDLATCFRGQGGDLVLLV